ncbi:related to high-affinity nickel transport protein nic1 [Melanopsichium pennsylvanicum]|uniref:Related to high-affinity nickel transport protein nic1 n=1 Tax=Melanopsichium pennsylvanicum TaxID=63383 RepID=A0AAJ5C7Y3_9BASI|nr:related to high-affinity nickel transport protein nic1 [Melanopsichium pennsylvanicum]
MRFWKDWNLPNKRPTLLLRCILLISVELVINGILWIVAAIVFGHSSRFLTLCLLSWTLGLRHALDADHISVIDNATRRIISLNHHHQSQTDKGTEVDNRPRRPVTCGLWFSLGHSTIVISVIFAISISLSIVGKLGKVSQVGGIVGSAVSGSTLFLFAIVNSILLIQSVRATRKYLPNHRQQQQEQQEKQQKPHDIDSSTRFKRNVVSDKQQVETNTPGQNANDQDQIIHDKVETHTLSKQPNNLDINHGGQGKEEKTEIEIEIEIETETVGKIQDERFRGIFTRLAYPLFRLVDRPYKLYPIGVLFGLGFDTASSIALLGIAGVTNTQVNENGDLRSSGDDVANYHGSNAWIILLALLFTSGMTLVDSLDSVLMINAYAPGELLLPPPPPSSSSSSTTTTGRKMMMVGKGDDSKIVKGRFEIWSITLLDSESVKDKNLDGKGTSSNLSHLLTLLSILLAFAISIITLMGVIGENCNRCVRAATKQQEQESKTKSPQSAEEGQGEGGGLEGRWWLFWQKANDSSGIIGACIVGGFITILLLYYIGKAMINRYRVTQSKSTPT